MVVKCQVPAFLDQGLLFLGIADIVGNDQQLFTVNRYAGGFKQDLLAVVVLLNPDAGFEGLTQVPLPSGLGLLNEIAQEAEYVFLTGSPDKSWLDWGRWLTQGGGVPRRTKWPWSFISRTAKFRARKRSSKNAVPGLSIAAS